MKFLDIQGVGVLWNSIKEKFLPLSGGTMSGDIELRGVVSRAIGLMPVKWPSIKVRLEEHINEGISNITNRIGLGWLDSNSVTNKRPSLKFSGDIEKTASIDGGQELEITQQGISLHNINSALTSGSQTSIGASTVNVSAFAPQTQQSASLTPNGIIIQDKTSNDLLHANGGTVNINDIAATIGEGYIPTSGGTISGGISGTSFDGTGFYLTGYDPNANPGLYQMYNAIQIGTNKTGNGAIIDLTIHDTAVIGVNYQNAILLNNEPYATNITDEELEEILVI